MGGGVPVAKVFSLKQIGGAGGGYCGGAGILLVELIEVCDTDGLRFDLFK